MIRLKWPYLPPGRAVLSFSGGPYDGDAYVVAGMPAGPGLGLPHLFWISTRGGDVGRRFQIVSPGRAASFNDEATDASPPLHVYEVMARRLDERGDILIDVGYRGQERRLPDE